MTLYGQEPEAALLGAFITKLGSRALVDVGAERGSFVQAMLDAGASEVHAFEPDPANTESLRRRFEKDGRVHLHEIAVSSADGEVNLHRSVDPTGEPVPFGHTLLERPDTDEIHWRETIRVEARSLSSLVKAGEIPRRVGILKVDTEGHDLAVVSSLGDLEADVVMVEHWIELPHSLGPCPWTADEMTSTLALRGFSHFAFVAHRGEFVSLQWDDCDVPAGHMGNLVFVHDRVVEDLRPDVLACAASLARTVLEVAEARTIAADDRLELIDELARDRDAHAATAEERLAATEELTRDHEAQLSEVFRQRDLHARAASERAAIIEQLTHDRDIHAKAAEERLDAIKASKPIVEELRRDRDLQTKAAATRLETIEKLKQERDLQAAAASERLAAIEKLKRDHEAVVEELRRDRELQAAAAVARLETIEELRGELSVQAYAAEERLGTIDELRRDREPHAPATEDLRASIDGLSRERDLQAQAAEERLETIEELRRELDLQTEAAEERLTTIEALRTELELQSRAAEERLGTIDELARERDLQALAADARLKTIEELANERDAHAHAAEQRLAAMEGVGRARSQDPRLPPQGWR